jgi:hypothetical protein
MKWWTNKEDAILRMIAQDARPMRELIHLLEGRSMLAANKRLRTLKLSKSRKDGCFRTESIAAVLRKGDNSISGVAQALGLSPQCIRPFITRMHTARRIHIVDRVLVGGTVHSRTLIFRYGKGVDMPPVSLEKTARHKARKEAKKEALEKVMRHVVVRRDPFIEAMYGSAA